ncbi:MAG: hypothetical protein RBR67_02780 [Desulfobacterium sp.]|jgi:hypothetical protein|nr:hypothetical protein [Desulfobacterium sp.]
MTHDARTFAGTVTGTAVFFILLIFQPPAWAIEQNDCITAYTNGSVNWRTGIVQATGKASPSENLLDEPPDAILIRAKLDAHQNLIHILMEIAFNRTNRDDFLPGDPVMAGVERRAMEATLTHQRYTSDRAMEATITTNMFGGFLQLVLPEEIGEVAGLKIIPPRKKPREKTQVEPYTGLIIDARGIDFQPTINPVIVSEQGDEIYSSRFISREYAVQAGVCQYSCVQDSIQQDPPIQASAWTNSRTGPNPLVIRGLRKGGKTNRHIIVSRSDASAVERTAERHDFMRQCRVVIVLDQ